MFIDEAEIYVRSGKGGDGCMSFRREKFEAFGGPDGGTGGDGGHVYLVATEGIDTLMDFSGKHHWRAENGQPGQGSGCTGRNGRDLRIQMPVGTLVYDADTGVLLKDLARPGDECRVVEGGKGGRGNKSFATPTQQAPRQWEPGSPAQQRQLRLELKLIADIGLVGLPNAGKSTLLSRMSKARPKIGAYPFTTLEPQLGIVELPGERRVVMADLPGLIEGAHQGAGLGDAFLRHIERTRVILHLIDVAPLDGRSPADAYRSIRNELASYSGTLASKPELVVATKIDLDQSGELIKDLEEEIGVAVVAVSAVSSKGMPNLRNRLLGLIGGSQEPTVFKHDLPTPPHLRDDYGDEHDG